MADVAVGSGPRYAPVDPSLPPPWRALVDGNTGYIYYWNTETNVTQYEKPAPPPPPPLPPGPPPGSAGPNQPRVTSSGTADVQRGRSAEGRSSANGSMSGSAVVSSHASGGAARGMSGGNLHTGGGGSSFPNSGGNVHGKPGSAVPYGNSSNNPPAHSSGHMHGSGHPGGPMPVSGGTNVPNSSAPPHGKSGGNALGNMYGNNHSNAPVHLSGHMPSSGPRSGPGMSAGGGHMNVSDNSYGSSSRNAYGSSGGTARGGTAARNIHGGAGGNVPVQPKLAALPILQRQQGVGGMHMPVQPRQLGHTASLSPGSSAAPITGPAAGYKRSSGDYLNHEPEPHKIPRVQGSLALDVDTYRRQHEITVVGDNVPLPFMTFDAANFPPEISRELHVAGFSAPTPIQAQSWPVALQSRDIVAIAKTGSGKTLGYLLPAFLHLSRARTNSRLGPVVLVLAPTRELATQIQDEAVKFGRSSRISCTCVYGGAPKGQQLRELDRGADIVIATPGRLNDFLEMRRVSLRQVSYLVLDEADRMLDMGFEPQIRKIVKEVPPRRQTLMYTATWPKEVRKIAADLLVNPVQVNIGNSDELTANKSITQHVEMVHPYEKQRRLEQILRSQEPGSKIIIFCSTKKMCDQLAHTLARGFGAAAIHGDKSQSERDYVLAQFKSGRSPILVATDVAARGLDIKDIRVVINFDFPTGVEDYVHRIGRTGRAGATGIAFTFFSEQDSKYAKELIGVLEGANQKVPIELRNIASKSTHLRGRGGRWDAGGMGARNSGYNSFGGGRGDARVDAFGRGSWGTQGGHFDRRERGFGERDRFAEGSGGRFSDDRNHSRDAAWKFGARERGHTNSRSRSRSPGWSRSPSRSRSRSRSYDRYSDDHYRRSPCRGRDLYKSRSPYRSVSPRSPSQSHVPHRLVKPAITSSEPHLVIDRSVTVKEPHRTDQATAPTVHYGQSPHSGRSLYRSRSPYRSVSPRSPYPSHSPYRQGKAAFASSEPPPSEQPAIPGVDKEFSPKSPYRSHSPYQHSKASITSKEPHPPGQPVGPGVDGEVSLPQKGLTDRVTVPTDYIGTNRSRSPCGSVSPRSPYGNHSPYRNSKFAIASNDVYSSEQPALPHVIEELSVPVEELPPTDQLTAPTVGSKFDIGTIDGSPPEQPAVLNSSTEIEELNQVVECSNDAGAENNPEV